MQKRLKDHYIPQLTGVIHDGQPIEPPQPLPWYPDELAWQMTASRKVVRKSPPFKDFQKFLVSETSVGNMSRQEAVSMIPPLLMDVRPGMAVLDMCAAPGSKAAQLLEMVHAGEEARIRTAARDAQQAEGRTVNPDGPEIEQEVREVEREQPEFPDDGRATGLLVANDAEYKRAYMLVHQLKRLNSANLIVTNHDATHFPSLALPTPPTPEGQIPQKRYLKFDRILADVPCSGDGTPRKNVNVWRDWSPGNALGLYPNQERLLVRALQMLKVGGRVVYSTCSMNPVENEAVVASAVGRCGGLNHVDIVDCSGMLPSLKRRPGLKSWIVMDKSGTTWKRWADVESWRQESGDQGLGRLAAGMFPPSGAVEELPLDRCMRVYGHLQDTGGFFIAVLEKRKEIRARPEGESKTSVPRMSEDKAETPPITAIVNELESKTANGSSAMEHISAADDLVARAMQPETEDSSHGKAGEPNSSITSDSVATAKREPQDSAPEPSSSEKRRKIDTDTPSATSPLPNTTAPALASEAAPPSTAPPTLSSLPPRAATIAHKKRSAPTEEPFTFLPPTHPVLTQCAAFYDLAPRFPRDRFLVRNAGGDAVKTVYYAAPAARDVLAANAGAGVKFVQSGVRMFVRQDVPRGAAVCGWRIQSEGLPLLAPWVGAHRVLRLDDRGVLRQLLVEMFPKVEGEGARDLGAWGEVVRERDMGCYLLRVQPGTGAEARGEGLVLPLWKGLRSVNLMLPKEDRRAMLLRLFGEDVPLVDHSVHQKKGTSEGVKEPGRRNSSSEPERASGALGAGQDDGTEGAIDLDDAADVEMATSSAVGVDDTGALMLADGDVEKEAELAVDLARGVKDELDVERAAAEHLAEAM